MEILNTLTSRQEAQIKDIRATYSKLAKEAQEIIDTLDVRDKGGKVLERGHNVIYKICENLRNNRDITEAVEIIGKDKWLRLNKIWENLRLLEKTEDRVKSS